MASLDTTLTAPLTLTEDGTIRITGSRVTLDSVVYAFKDGATAEQIHYSFPSLTLRQIYGAISYYLEHTPEVEDYLRQQEQVAEEVRREIESRQDNTALIERIRGRYAKMREQ